MPAATGSARTPLDQNNSQNLKGFVDAVLVKKKDHYCISQITSILKKFKKPYSFLMFINLKLHVNTFQMTYYNRKRIYGSQQNVGLTIDRTLEVIPFPPFTLA